MKRNWYAVYTKANQEKRVAALLSKKKVETFLPLNRIVTTQGNKSRMEFEPLIACFVFVCITEAEMEVIKRLNFVLNFVYWLGSPAIIKDVEIDNIKNFIGQYSNIRLEKINVSTNGIVKIISLAKKYSTENFVHTQNSLTTLVVPSLGYSLISEKQVENSGSLEFIVENNLS